VYESAQKRNDLQAALGSLMWMLSHWIRRGDREQMRAVMDQAPPYLQRSHSRSMVIWSGAMLGLAHYQLGNIDAARQAADPALKIVQRKSPISSWLHEPFSALAELYLNFWQDGDRGSRASAKIACKALMNLGSVYRVSLPCAHIWQGRFHFLDGDLRRAAHCWQQALVTARHYRTPFYEGLAYHYLAQQPFDDPDEQQRHLEAAKAIFERLSEMIEHADLSLVRRLTGDIVGSLYETSVTQWDPLGLPVTYGPGLVMSIVDGVASCLAKSINP
jgi:tetratricopeptide (TPR) repeat protein